MDKKEKKREKKIRLEQYDYYINDHIYGKIIHIIII